MKILLPTSPIKRGTNFIGVGTGSVIFNDAGEVLITQRDEKTKNKWKDIACIEESQMTLASRQNLRTYREKYQK